MWGVRDEGDDAFDALYYDAGSDYGWDSPSGSGGGAFFQALDPQRKKKSALSRSPDGLYPRQASQHFPRPLALAAPHCARLCRRELHA